METRFSFIAIVAIATAACAVLVLGCESREGQGSCVFGCIDAEIEDDSWTTSDGSTALDVWPPGEASTDDAGADINVPTAAEYCTPYIGSWECTCTGGTCTKGQKWYYVITLLQVNGNGTWTMWIEQIDGWSGSFTCDPLNPPPRDDYDTTWFVTSPNTMEEDFHHNETQWLTSSCIRLE